MKNYFTFVNKGLKPLVLIGIIIGVLPAAAQTVVTLPPPTGSYGVGRANYAFVDAARSEPFLTGVESSREVVARVYYPAVVTDGKPAPYAEGLEADALTQLTGYPPDVIADYVQSYAVANVPVSDAAKSYPVVVFTGDVAVIPLMYTSLLEDLASQGYVVLALAHPYSSPFAVFPDGRTAFPVANANTDEKAARDQVGAVWAADVRFILDQLSVLNSSDALLAGRLDLTKIALVGHGLGGAAVLDVALADNRVVSAVSLDGLLLGDASGKELATPFLFIDPANSQLRSGDEDAALDALKGSSKAEVYTVTIEGADAPTFVTDNLAGLFSSDNAAVQKSQAEVTLVRSYVDAFLGKYLLGQDAPILDSVD